jgi:hypothetical protein
MQKKAAFGDLFTNITDVTPCYLVFYKSVTNAYQLYLSAVLIRGHG